VENCSGFKNYERHAPSDMTCELYSIDELATALKELGLLCKRECAQTEPVIKPVASRAFVTDDLHAYHIAYKRESTSARSL
jgi:signal recognition particle subunit SEC65